MCPQGAGQPPRLWGRLSGWLPSSTEGSNVPRRPEGAASAGFAVSSGSQAPELSTHPGRAAGKAHGVSHRGAERGLASPVWPQVLRSPRPVSCLDSVEGGDALVPTRRGFLGDGTGPPGEVQAPSHSTHSGRRACRPWTAATWPPAFPQHARASPSAALGTAS